MEPPRFDPDTVQLEEQVRRSVNDYFGRMAEGVDPTRQSLYAQNMTDNWLAGFRKVARQTLSLCEQYLSDEEIMRITGVPLRTIRDPQEKAREYDFQLEFNAQDLNLEMVLKKLKVINKAVLPGDTMGIIDRAFIAMGDAGDRPDLAEGAVRSQQTATNAEIEDEPMSLPRSRAGSNRNGGERTELWAAPAGADRHRAENPNIQRPMQGDQIFTAMIQNRLKHFQFQLQQQQNAQIGRVGAAPTLEGPRGAAATAAPAGVPAGGGNGGAPGGGGY